MATPGEELLLSEQINPFDISDQLGDDLEEEDNKTSAKKKEEDVSDVKEEDSTDDLEEETLEEEEMEEEEESEEDLEEEESDEEEDEEEDEEDSVEKRGTIILAESYKNDGILPKDFKIKEDLTGQELKQALADAAKEEARPELEAEIRAEFDEKGMNEADLEYVQLIKRGGTEKTVREHYAYTRLAEAKLEKEEDKERVIRYMFNDQGVDPEDAEEILNQIDDTEELDKKVAKAQKYFSNKADQILEEEKKRLELEDKEMAAKQKELENTYRSLIHSGEINGVKLNKDDQKALEKFFLDKTEKVTITDPRTGKPLRRELSGFRKWLMDTDQSHEKLLELALFALMGKDFFVKKGEFSAKDELMEQLDSKVTKKKKKRRKKPEEVDDVLLELADNVKFDIKF